MSDAWAACARVLSRGLAVLLLLLAAIPAQAEDGAVRFGLWPYHSPRHLALYYEDLGRHLQERLGREVALETAPSIETFMQRLLRAEYDIALLGPHYARLAQTDYGWQPIAGYTGANPVYLVGRKQGGIRKPADLKGKTIATHERTLLLSLTAKKWLKSQGLTEKDYHWLEIGGLASSVHALVAGEADAAVTSLASLSLSPQAELDQLHILGEAGSNPQLYVFASPAFHAGELKALQKACKEFVQDGRHPLGGIDARELRSMDEFSAEIRQHLKTTSH